MANGTALHVPTWTLPKLREGGPMVIWAGVGPEEKVNVNVMLPPPARTWVGEGEMLERVAPAGPPEVELIVHVLARWLGKLVGTPPAPIEAPSPTNVKLTDPDQLVPSSVAFT
jgi:hypothetical protein